jgi:hypothetical protein
VGYPDFGGSVSVRCRHADKGADRVHMKKSAIFFLLLIISSSMIPLAASQVEIKPQVELSNKGMRVEYLPTDDTLTQFTDKDGVKTWTGVRSSVRYYELPPSDQYEGGGHEYDLILKEKPLSNVFSFKIETENLELHYQPPLTEEIKNIGWTVNATHALNEKGELVNHRPENVVGSFAVYTRAGNKIMHIFRPLIMDSKDGEVWGEMSILGETLTISVPQKFLDDAVYPVIIDPTFGYTTIGASTDDNPFGNIKVAWRHLNQVGDGNITSVSIYGRAVTTAGLMRAAVYTTGVTTPFPPQNLLAQSNEVNVTTTAQWWNFTLDAYVWNNTQYYLSIIRKPGFLNFRNYYDAGSTLQAVQEADTYADGFSAIFDGGGDIDFNFSRKGSSYANVSLPTCPPASQNVTGVWTYFNASEIGVTTGTLDSGALVNVTTVDGTRYNVSEVAGVPGIDISVNFTGIPSDARCLWLVINSLYDGNAAHDFDVQVWNYTGSSWEDIGHITDATAFEWINSTIYDLRIPNDYVSSGEVRARLYHTAAGNINHDLSIEFINILANIQSDVTPTGGEVDVSLFIALAIILSLIAYLLARAEK